MANRKNVSPRDMLKGIGAKHIRTGKHEVWRLPNNRTVVLSSTPSDRHAEQNQIRDIKREMVK